MELSELKDRIIASFSGAEEDLNEILELVEKDHSVFPFNEYEHLSNHVKPTWNLVP